MQSFFRGSALLFLCALAAPLVAQTKLRTWNIHPEGYPVTAALRSFAQEIGRTTGGRYQVDIYSNAVLGDQPKAVQMLKDGEVDLAEFSSGALVDVVPGLKALNLPFLFQDSAHMFRHLDGRLGAGYAERLKAAGYVVLGWYDGGARSFYCNGRPLSGLKDLEGARVRVQQSEVYFEMIKLLHAQPVSVPLKDVYSAFEEGKIDCAENNMPTYETSGHYKVAKSVYLTGHVVSAEMLVMSSKMWNSLNPYDRSAFTRAGANSAMLMRELWRKRVASSVDVTGRQGSQFVHVNDIAPFVARMRPLYRKYLDDPVTMNDVLTVIAD